jgi:hypothetical protein
VRDSHPLPFSPASTASTPGSFQASTPRRTGQSLIEKALDALDEQATAAAPTTATGAVVLEALQARPYPDIDLTPPRVRLTNVRDVVL